MSKKVPLNNDRTGNIISSHTICPISTPTLKDNIPDKDKFVVTSCNFVDNPNPCIKPNIKTAEI